MQDLYVTSDWPTLATVRLQPQLVALTPIKKPNTSQNHLLSDSDTTPQPHLDVVRLLLVVLTADGGSEQQWWL